MNGQATHGFVEVGVTADGRIQLGDTVRTTAVAHAQGISPATFVVKSILRDWFGELLLQEPGGYGFGAQYCELAND